MLYALNKLIYIPKTAENKYHNIDTSTAPGICDFIYILSFGRNVKKYKLTKKATTSVIIGLNVIRMYTRVLWSEIFIPNTVLKYLSSPMNTTFKISSKSIERIRIIV